MAPIGKLARLLQTWGGMAKFRHRPRLAKALFLAAVSLDGELQHARRELAKSRSRIMDDVQHINALILGTTGTCNASCIHCPTGKESTARSPRGTMSMALFRKIIDGVVEQGLAIESHIGFGLFGDGLVDPLVLERAKYAHERLPDAILSVNTNGAAYNHSRHAALFPHITLLALHCESLVPETYDFLMTPLRAKNVLPKYEQILRDFPGKVRISIPVSRANRDELTATRAWFMKHGAKEVVFDPMSSRCMQDQTLFNQLSLSPSRIRCDANVTRDLIVDCDGMVLPCCNDFAREQPIGNLTFEKFEQTMRSLARRQFAERMAKGEHDCIPLCSRCFGDIRTPDFPFDHAVRPLGSAEARLS
jgi:radical SAM protein with 4Fe4S-binding SPASM domain